MEFLCSKCECISDFPTRENQLQGEVPETLTVNPFDDDPTNWYKIPRITKIDDTKGSINKIESAQKYYDAGNCHKNHSEIDLAIQSYQFCLDLDPSNTRARYNLGVLVQKQMESTINVNLGNIKLEQGDVESAIEFFIAAKELNPTNVVAWVNLGLIYQYKGELEASLLCLQKAISLDASNATAYYNFACALHDSGRLVEAISMYEVALDLSPHHRDAFFNLGVANHELGREKKALQNYQKALLLDPSFEEARQAVQSFRNNDNPSFCNEGNQL